MRTTVRKSEARRLPYRGNERRLVTQHPRRRFLYLAVGAAVPALSRVAGAQAYPTRPVTMIVPFAAGGGSDIIARSVAERMRLTLNQPIIIENVTGAGGSIGAGRVARAAPDGYTLCTGNLATHVMNGATHKLQYDLLNDFEPVALSSLPRCKKDRETSPSKMVA
jgi:tripartite-type tricarboxylate transporter receptor subunit TctC